MHKCHHVIPREIFQASHIESLIQEHGVVKYKDPGRPTTKVSFGTTQEFESLLDLGAGVNIMPTYLYKRLGLQKYKPTKFSIRLADQSITQGKGIVENVLVKIKEFYYPVDFVLLDTDEDNTSIPLILG